MYSVGDDFRRKRFTTSQSQRLSWFCGAIVSIEAATCHLPPSHWLLEAFHRRMKLEEEEPRSHAEPCGAPSPPSASASAAGGGALGSDEEHGSAAAVGVSVGLGFDLKERSSKELSKALKGSNTLSPHPEVLAGIGRTLSAASAGALPDCQAPAERWQTQANRCNDS